MGADFAIVLAQAVAQGRLSLKVAIREHLLRNLAPSPGMGWAVAGVRAVEALRAGDGDAWVKLPHGVKFDGKRRAPAQVLVETFHLQAFVIVASQRDEVPPSEPQAAAVDPPAWAEVVEEQRAERGAPEGVDNPSEGVLASDQENKSALSLSGGLGTPPFGGEEGSEGCGGEKP